MHVVRGAGKLLERCAPAWLMEVTGDLEDSYAPANELLKSLGERGYSVYRMKNGKLLRYCQGDKSINYFFLRAWQEAELRSVGMLD